MASGVGVVASGVGVMVLFRNIKLIKFRLKYNLLWLSR